MNDDVRELLDACDAVVALHRRLAAPSSPEERVAHAAVQPLLEQLEVAVRLARRQHTARSDPGE